MGTWDIGHFDNDIACDWAYGLESSHDLSIITQAIDAVFNEEYVDADIGCEALAAIETLARLKGKPGEKNAYTEAVDNWVEQNPQQVPEELLIKAKSALSRIQGKESELYELWAESDDLGAWIGAVKDLESRLGGCDHGDR